MGEYVKIYGVWIGIMAIAAVGSIIYSVMYFKKNKRDVATFLEKHPDASKIYMTQKGTVTSEVIQILSVNGEKPLKFDEGMKGGVYVAPAKKVELGLDYIYTRPGVMYKSVTKTTGLVNREVEVEANKEYKVGYDRKAQDFTFEEK